MVKPQDKVRVDFYTRHYKLCLSHKTKFSSFFYYREFNRAPEKKDWALETILLQKRLDRDDRYASFQMHCEYNDDERPPIKRRKEIWLLALA